MNKFILYVLSSCPFCQQAEELLQRNNKEFAKVSFDGHVAILDHVKRAYAYHTVPMIFHVKDKDINFIGGYTDLVTYLDGEQ